MRPSPLVRFCRHTGLLWRTLMVSLAAWVGLGMGVGRAAGQAGELDPGFYDAAYCDDLPRAMAELPDGRILLGGAFQLTNGVARDRLAVLLPNGLLDTTAVWRAPLASNLPVRTIAVQPDGKILLGGSFMLARLLPNGQPDPSFNAALTQSDGQSYVGTLTVLTDGRILVGGKFSQLGGVPCVGLARLLPDGQIDSSFLTLPGAQGGFVGEVRSLTPLDDGRVFAGGDFNTLNGGATRLLARLLPDGLPDPAWSASLAPLTPQGGVNSVQVLPAGEVFAAGGFVHPSLGVRRNAILFLPDGFPLFPQPGSMVTTDLEIHSALTLMDLSVVIAGRFNRVGSQTMAGLARLTPQFMADLGFFPQVSPPSGTHSALVTGKGRLLCASGPGATTEGTRSQIYAYRLQDGFSFLTLEPDNRVSWVRTGGLPQITGATADYSIDQGVTWRPLGTMFRSLGGWELPPRPLNSRVLLRARGMVRGGTWNASSGIMEERASFDRGPGAPSLKLTLPAGDYPASRALQWSQAPAGSRNPLTIRVANMGSAPLTGVRFSVSGQSPDHFAVSPAVLPPLEPGDAAEVPVEYLAFARGIYAATLQVTADAGLAAPATVSLQGDTTGPVAEIGVRRGAVELPSGAVVDFGTLLTNQSGPEQTLTISNAGPGPLAGLSAWLAGPDAASWHITAEPSAPLASGAATSLRVRYTPLTAGSREADLFILNSDPDEGLYRIRLTGTAQTPEPTGVPDVSFGVDGTAVLSALESGAVSDGNALTVLADGRILVAGRAGPAGTGSDMALWRFLPDGHPDTSLNGTGLATVDFATGTASARALTVMADGRMVLAGAVDGTFAVARLLPDGSPDPSFHGDGRVLTAFGPAAATVAGVAVDAAGRIVVAGAVETVDEASAMALARYLPDGALDGSFGAGGLLSAYIGDTSGISALTWQSDGRILTAGYSGTAGSLRFTLTQFTAAGNPDGAFGSGGVTLTDPGGSGVPLAMQVDASGRIVMAGASGGAFAVTRQLPGGAADTGFGQGGTVKLSGSAPGTVRALALAADGSVVLAGDAPPDVARVLRLNANGTPDLLFPPVTAATLPPHLSGVALQPGSRILLTGTSATQQMVLLRLTGNPVPRAVLRARAAGGDGIWQYGGYAGRGSIDFGRCLIGAARGITVIVENTGSQSLQGAAVSLEGTDAAHYRIAQPLPATLAAGQSASLVLEFTPPDAALRTAQLRVQSAALDGGAFTLQLTGSGAAAQASDAWRQEYFGQPGNAGAGADESDPDGDGLINLAEFALATHPLQPGAPGTVRRGTGALEWDFTRRSAALDEVTVAVESAAAPGGPWQPAGSRVTETVLSEADGIQQVRLTLPWPEGGGRSFLRLRFTRR